MDETLRVSGYREFLRTCDRAGKETKQYVRSTLREVVDIVKEDAQSEGAGRLGTISPHTAEGLRSIVRARGGDVEESLRKTTGRRPDWGKVVIGRLEDSLDAKEPEVELAMEHAIDKVADHFEH